MKNYKLKINGNSYSVDINNVEGQIIELEVNGTPYKIEVDKEIKQSKTPKLVRKEAVPSTDSTPSTVKTTSSSKIGSIKAPLPGTILDVYVNVGDHIKTGQKLMLLEAMKMENQIDSDMDGIVKEVKVRKGDVIMEGDVLVTIGE